MQFPIYILPNNDICIPDEFENISHTRFWKLVVSKTLGEMINVNPKKLENYPYCLKRARLVGERLYCGEKISKKSLAQLEQAIGKKVVIVYDDHEKRLSYDVANLKRLTDPYLR